jgi:large subunit ribosomal protein L33
MAKKRSTVVIRLVSQAGTGFFYTLRKAVRANAEKLQLMKHDPRVNAHVLFKEEKIKKIKPPAPNANNDDEGDESGLGEAFDEMLEREVPISHFFGVSKVV